MIRFRKFILRVGLFLAVVAIVGMVAASVPGQRPSASPYASSLAKLVVRNANASPCPIEKCRRHGVGYICVHNNAFTECLITNSTTCNTQSCVVH
ncbi:MAG TPA: hypothetical protein VGK93_10200 [Candidatus Eisenbacteria bacterium]|jgi:hypothetical protein